MILFVPEAKILPLVVLGAAAPVPALVFVLVTVAAFVTAMIMKHLLAVRVAAAAFVVMMAVRHLQHLLKSIASVTSYSRIPIL